MKVYRHKSGEMYKAGWVSPPPASYGGVDHINDERFKELRESGINLIHVITELEDLSVTRRIVECAKKNDVELVLPLADLLRGEFNEEKVMPVLEALKDWDNVVGINLFDEPGRHYFDKIKKVADFIRPYIGDRMIYVNHMPMYATASQLEGGWWTPYEDEAQTSGYYEFLDEFYQKIDVEVISYDFYPFRHEKGCSDPRYFEQLCVAKKLSDKYDKPVWNFTQVTSWNRDAVRNMTYAEMAWMNHTSIACGVTGIQYFCYWTPCDGVENFENAMIARNGSRTKHYYFAQDLNRKLDALAPYILDAKFYGTIAYGNTIVPFPRESALKSFGNIDRVLSDGMLIGCFEKDGKYMYYAVNTSVFETKVLEFTFKKSISAELLLGTEKLSFEGAELKQVVGPGEAVLIAEM